jgi:hypothetical protein
MCIGLAFWQARVFGWVWIMHVPSVRWLFWERVSSKGCTTGMLPLFSLRAACHPGLMLLCYSTQGCRPHQRASRGSLRFRCRPAQPNRGRIIRHKRQCVEVSTPFQSSRKSTCSRNVDSSLQVAMNERPVQQLSVCSKEYCLLWALMASPPLPATAPLTAPC